MSRHEHDWYPITSTRPVGGEAEVILWACAGRTDDGSCIATATADTVQRERRKQTKEREAEAAEREQRHWNWEE